MSLKSMIASVVARINPPNNSSDPPLPDFLQFDEDATSEFGAQVVLTMSLAPDSWVVHKNLRKFAHQQLGEFAYDPDHRLRHMGEYGRVGSPSAVQRALTKGDCVAITEAYRFMLLRPVSADNPKQPVAAPPSQQMSAMRSFSPFMSHALLGFDKQFMENLKSVQARQATQAMQAMQARPALADHKLDAVRYAANVASAEPKQDD